MNGIDLRRHLGSRTAGAAKRAAAFVGLALAAAGLPAEGRAQLIEADVPPVVTVRDHHGVDLVSGKMMAVFTTVAIGPGGPGSIAYHWGSSNSVQSELFGYVEDDYPTAGKYTVTIGGTSETFTLSGALGSGTFTNDQGRAATLAYDAAAARYTYTRGDGAIALFSKSVSSGGTAAGTPYILSLTYPSGEKLTYAYQLMPATAAQPNGYYQVRTVSSSLGYQLRYSYASTSTGYYRVANVTLFNMASETCGPDAESCALSGTWPSLTFDGTGNATDSLQRVTRWEQDATTKQVTVTYPTGRKLIYSFDSYDRVTGVNDGKATWTYSYPNPYGGVTVAYRPEGGDPRVVNYTSKGWVTSEAFAGVTTHYTHDSYGRVLTAKPTSGSVVSETQYTYDARGNVTQVRRISTTPGTPADIVTSTAYPSTCSNPKTCNKPAYWINPRGGRTDYAYDETHGGVTSITPPAGANGIRPQTRYSYTALSATYRSPTGSLIQGAPAYKLTGSSQCMTQASCIGTADEARVTTSYGTHDALLPVSTTRSSGDGAVTATEAITYHATGDVRTVDDPGAGTADTVRNYYDAGRQLVGTIGPDPDGSGPLARRALRFSYNADGRQVSREAGTAAGQGDGDMATFQPIEQEFTDYDGQGRVEKQRFVSGGVTSAVEQIGYTSGGLLECRALRMNPAAYGSLPASACTQGQAGSDGADRISRNSYSSHFRLTSVAVGVGTAQERNEVVNTYTPLGDLATVADAKGNLTTYEYDGFRRSTRTYFPSASAGTQSSTADYEERGYDAASNLTYLRNRKGQVTTFAFDALNQPTSEASPAPYPGRTYGYDNLGRVRSASISGGAAVALAYDALGRPTSETGPLGTVTSQYDTAGQRSRLAWPNGYSVDYDYDATGSVTAIRETGHTSGPGVLATFTYDNLGRRTAMGRGNGTVVSYNYDSSGRFSSVSQDLAGTTHDLGITFGYNPADQVRQRASTNDAFAWSGYYGVNRPYGANGLNQLTSAGSVALSYDGAGNLIASGADSFGYNHLGELTSASTSLGSANLEYDAAGRLLATVGSTTTRFLYDGDDLIAEYDAAGNVLRRYVHGLSDDEPLVWYEGAGTADRRWLATEELGSIVAVVNASGGALAVNSYDEFGIPGGSNLGRFQYTGQIWLPEIGLYHYKARAYSPTLGRFMQPDPIGYGDGMNMYAYVLNDPMNDWDATGLCGGRGQMPCDSPDIVVTGRRNYEDSNRRFAEQSYADYARQAASFGAQFLPGYGAYECIRDGCSAGGWLMAAADFTPVGKGANLLVRGGRALARTGRSGGTARRITGNCGCLEAGTLVATPEGLVAIETIEVGDLVLSKNEVTGEVAAKPVTELIRPAAKPLHAVTLGDGDSGTETFNATEDHPWKVAGRGWVSTADLRANDRIETAQGAPTTVLGVQPAGRSAQAYNLEVADWHTFFVGDDLVLVHNGCNRGFPRSVKNNYARDRCERCGANTPRSGPDRRGVSPDPSRSELHHRQRRADGGPNTAANAENLCRTCHQNHHRGGN